VKVREWWLDFSPASVCVRAGERKEFHVCFNDLLMLGERLYASLPFRVVSFQTPGLNRVVEIGVVRDSRDPARYNIDPVLCMLEMFLVVEFEQDGEFQVAWTGKALIKE
jgi:hypothetical protein